MEATGIYSMPVYYALLEHGNFDKVLICNAAHVKNVPGRKTDYAGRRVAGGPAGVRAAGGQLRRPPIIKAARDVTRYRMKIVQQRVSEIARLGKTLEDAQLTELRERMVVSGRSAGARAARFPACDQRRGWRAGSVVAEGAALRGG